jgi:histidine triad (HIT) family protein
MTFDANCIFCKIIRGQVPSFKLYENDKTFAFMDINPITPGHALIVPKFHARDIFETPDEWVGAAMVTTRRIARAVQAAVQPYGMNVVQANGPGAKQSVFHLHIHVVPRLKDDNLPMNWPINPGDKDAIAKLAESIRANLPKD